MTKRILAYLAFVPLVAFVVNLFLLLFGEPEGAGLSWYAVGALQVAILLVATGLMPVYLSQIVHNDELSRSEKIVWSAGVILFSVFAIPKYYLRYLRNSS